MDERRGERVAGRGEMAALRSKLHYQFQYPTIQHLDARTKSTESIKGEGGLSSWPSDQIVDCSPLRMLELNASWAPRRERICGGVDLRGVPASFPPVSTSLSLLHPPKPLAGEKARRPIAPKYLGPPSLVEPGLAGSESHWKNSARSKCYKQFVLFIFQIK